MASRSRREASVGPRTNAAAAAAAAVQPRGRRASVGALAAAPGPRSIAANVERRSRLTPAELARENAAIFEMQRQSGLRLPDGFPMETFRNGISELNNATVERNAAAAIAYVPEGPNARFSLSPAQLQAIHGADPVRAPNGPPVQRVARGEFASLAHNPMRRLAEENENMRVVHGIPSSEAPPSGPLPARRNLPAGLATASNHNGMDIGGYRRRRKHRTHTRRVRRRKSTRKNNKRK